MSKSRDIPVVQGNPGWKILENKYSYPVGMQSFQNCPKYRRLQELYVIFRNGNLNIVYFFLFVCFIRFSLPTGQLFYSLLLTFRLESV